jgi:hypothetical protein
MNSDLNASEKEKESQESPRQPPIARSAALSTIPPETLKNLLAASDSIQRYAVQNQRIIDQLAQTTALFESMNPHLMSELSKVRHPRQSRWLDERDRLKGGRTDYGMSQQCRNGVAVDSLQN